MLAGFKRAQLTRDVMAEAGRDVVGVFCRANDMTPPRLGGTVPQGRLQLYGGTCGLYDGSRGGGTVYVNPADCARLGYGGPAWSWPGYIADRTPFGVYAHELGHHVDRLLGYPSGRLRQASGEPPITSYAPNPSEWFAEMFRLFVTNPDLLWLVRPATYRIMVTDYHLVPVEEGGWREVLAEAPARTLARAEVKIAAASQGRYL